MCIRTWWDDLSFITVMQQLTGICIVQSVLYTFYTLIGTDGWCWYHIGIDEPIGQDTAASSSTMCTLSICLSINNNTSILSRLKWKKNYFILLSINPIMTAPELMCSSFPFVHCVLVKRCSVSPHNCHHWCVASSPSLAPLVSPNNLEILDIFLLIATGEHNIYNLYLQFSHIIYYQKLI